MLDNEPTTSDSTPQDTEQAAAPPRRRRAASRPAGPPSQAPSQPQPVTPPADVAADVPADVPAAAPIEASSPEPGRDSTSEPSPEPTAAPARTARKRTAKKAAAAPLDVTGESANGESVPTDAEPTTRPARKRGTRKAGAPSVVPEPTAEPTLIEPESTGAALTELSEANAQADPAASAGIDTSGESAPEPAAEPAPRTRSRRRGLVRNPFEVPTIASLSEPTVADTDTTDATDTESVDVTEDDPALEADATPALEPDADADENDEDDNADETDEADDETSDEASDEGDDQPRRRRRRRGGRRRRRGGSDDSSDDESGADSADSTDSGDATGSETEGSTDRSSDDTDDSGDDTGDPDGANDGTTRRRRRRRRRGEDTAGAEDDPSSVVVKVREPRGRKSGGGSASNEVTGIEGSTRVEAKRQRRREGRDSGRRRAPILSEAEFLTRRESVKRTMVIRQRPSSPDQTDLTQIAVLEDGVLVEHYVDQDSGQSIIGNVYLGRVQNVLPSMEAAFIDIGKGRNAVLYAGEVDWDSFGAHGDGRRVEQVLKSGQTILVQVTKDPIGAKGARLTNHVSIPGRYIVYSPGGHLSGISRKLPENERKRLKDVLSDLIDENASVIVRTAAEGASEEELVRDVTRLKAQWEDIAKKLKGTAPQLLYGEPDLTVRIVRDLFTEDFAELLIDGNGSSSDAYDTIDGYVRHVAPHLAERMKRWDGTEHDVFHEFRVDEQIAKALERKVHLPSGGSLIIDRTEAMTVIDVNTGKFTGSAGNLEATVTSNNLEAAEEIVRQLRLRDIGGIIVIDFIDMVLPVNRELLLRRLVECLGRDRTRHQVAEVTSLGLVQMTRKRIGTGLLEAFSTECPHCHGRGVEISELPIEKHDHSDDRDSRRGGGGGGNSGGGNSGGGNGGGGNGGGGNGGGGNSGGGRGKRSGRSGSSSANGGGNANGGRSRSDSSSNGSDDSANDTSPGTGSDSNQSSDQDGRDAQSAIPDIQGDHADAGQHTEQPTTGPAAESQPAMTAESTGA